MKKEQLQELIKNNVKLPEGVEFDSLELDWDTITENVNKATNDVVKSESERASEKAQKDLLKKHGFESIEEFEKALEKEPESEDKLEKLSKEVETLRSNLQEKDNQIRAREQKDVLKNLGFKEDRLDRAHKLVTSELGEDDDFEEKAKAFRDEVPEWVAGKDGPKNLGKDSDGEGDEPNNIAETFKNAFSTNKK